MGLVLAVGESDGDNQISKGDMVRFTSGEPVTLNWGEKKNRFMCVPLFECSAKASDGSFPTIPGLAL